MSNSLQDARYKVSFIWEFTKVDLDSLRQTLQITLSHHGISYKDLEVTEIKEVDN